MNNSRVKKKNQSKNPDGGRGSTVGRVVGTSLGFTPGSEGFDTPALHQS